MFVISTRSFPPEIGGMQNLMGGLANALVNHGPVKVFADKSENFDNYDQTSKAEIERFGGIKILRKYRKANRIFEYIKSNQKILCLDVSDIMTHTLNILMNIMKILSTSK